MTLLTFNPAASDPRYLALYLAPSIWCSPGPLTTQVCIVYLVIVLDVSKLLAFLIWLTRILTMRF